MSNFFTNLGIGKRANIEKWLKDFKDKYGWSDMSIDLAKNDNICIKHFHGGVIRDILYCSDVPDCIEFEILNPDTKKPPSVFVRIFEEKEIIKKLNQLHFINMNKIYIAGFGYFIKENNKWDLII